MPYPPQGSEDVAPRTALITYPTNGKRKTGVKAGTWEFNFTHGRVTLPDNTEEEMSNSLISLGDTKIRSCFILVSDSDAIVKYGRSNIVINDHILLHLMQEIEIESLSIEFPSGRIPQDDFQLGIMASTNPIIPLDIDTQLSHNRSKVTGSLTDNNYKTVYQTHVGGYDQIMFTIENTHAANGLTVQIDFSEDGVDWYQDPDFDTAINIPTSASQPIKYATSVKHHLYRVKVRNTGAGLNSSYKVHQNLIR